MTECLSVVAYAPSKSFTEISVKTFTAAREKTMPTDVGQQAPDFSLYDADKNLRSLSEFRGRNVVLAFFPGAFTGTCTDEMCNFQDRLEEFNSINAQVIGVSVDPPFSQKEWTTQNRITYPFLSDFNRQVVTDYDVTFENLAGLQGYISANRAIVIIDRSGVIQYKWVAANPGVEPDYDEVKQALVSLNA